MPEELIFGGYNGTGVVRAKKNPRVGKPCQYLLQTLA
jgi:hypothetical protein